MKKLFFGISTLALTFAAGATWAQTAPIATAAAAIAPDDVQEVVVTGTRTSGLKAIDSAAPIQVLDAGTLRRNGQPDLISSLAQNVPSFTAQALGGDAANLTLSARLRGLSPNDTLVLIDGVRRHGTASLAVLGGPYQGGAAADLNFIPVASIDHVEVLTDGAAAQYGTDAIAGVVNIILKKNPSGGAITATGGQYYDEGGVTGDVSVNAGFEPIANSYLNVTVESRFHGHSDRGNPDPRLYNHDGINNVGPGGPYALGLDFPGAPEANHISGDALYHLNIMSYNAGYDFGNGLLLYSFGTYGHKNGQAFENYRTPDKAPSLYPTGYNPKEELDEDDFAATIGASDKLYGWNIDVSTTYGKDSDLFHTEGSANNTFAAADPLLGHPLTQTDFYDGKFIDSQWTSNVDVSRDFDIHMAGPLTVAGGVEYRKDTYEVGAGEPNSYNGSGAASFPGLTPLDSGHHDRENVGVYGDLALSPIDKLKIDAAARFEHFSDFGNTTVFKLTGRYDFTPQYALRGTVSSGFRAPTLAEEYYANVNVGPITAFAQLPPNSPGAAALGINGLKPEQSDNYSIGLVAHPIPKLTATIDAYDIIIKDRIVSSGNIYGTGNPTGFNSAAVNAALNSFVGGADTLAGDTMTGVNLFANGLSTRTEGVEFVITYSDSYGPWGHVDWSVAGAYNDTKVTKINASSPTYAPQTLYDAPALSYLTDASPKVKIVFGALWTYQLWTVAAHETVYGDSSELAIGDDGVTYRSTISTTAITDLDVSYQFRPNVKLTIGANDLFNQYPDKLNPDLVASYRKDDDNSAVAKYPDFSPFGINGGYYYGKVTLTF